MTAYAYAALPSFTVRTPKLAIFFVGERAMGQIRSVNPSLTNNVSETDFSRVGDDTLVTVETTVKADNTMTVDLYERGLDRKELKLMLGVIEGFVGTVTLSEAVAAYDCYICVYATKTTSPAQEPENVYHVAGFRPRSWSLTNDAESKDLLHRISGKITSMHSVNPADYLPA